MPTTFAMRLLPIFLTLTFVAFSSALPQPILAGEIRGTATMTYADAEPLVSKGAIIKLDNHCTVRCYDWDQDGDLDLIAGDGGGRLWLIKKQWQPNSPQSWKRNSHWSQVRNRNGEIHTQV